ncbi:MAG: hypothetical protein ACJ77K_08040 [Bacteroidia bacterium]
MTAVRKIKTGKKKFTPHLRVIRGGKFYKEKNERRIEQLWLFCHASLWNNQQFEESEINEFKKLISEFFSIRKDTDATFKQLVERVCLAKRYVCRRSGRYIAKPIDWLNINYKNGLAGTASWYKQVQEQRKTVPHYNEGISTLANAVLDYCKTRNVLGVPNYRIELLKQKQYDLLQMYMNALMHIHYLSY